MTPEMKPQTSLLDGLKYLTFMASSLVVFGGVLFLFGR